MIEEFNNNIVSEQYAGHSVYGVCLWSRFHLFKVGIHFPNKKSSYV